MVTREQVLERTKQIIIDNAADQFGTDLQESTRLNSSTNVDSMGFILVITKLEGEFGIKIPDDEWNEIQTLGELVDSVMKYLPKE